MDYMPESSQSRIDVKRVLVTGVAGFMGSHEAEWLLREGYEVYGVDDLSGGYMHNVPKGCRFTKLDLRDRKKVERYISKVKPEIIFHDAADATEGRSQFTPISATERNYLAYMYLLVSAIRAGFRKMVLASSMSVYGAQKPPFTENMDRRPEDVYAIAKASMEHATEVMARVHRFAYTIIRPHNVYGPRQNLRDPYRNVISIFINALLNDKPFYIYGDGEQRRSFTYIADYTPHVIKAGLSDGFSGEIFNIGPREEVSINQLGRIVLDQFFGGEDKVPPRLRPKSLPARPLEVKEAYCSSDKAERLLGYRTTVPIEEGVRLMIEWARKMGPQSFNYLKDGLEIVSPDTPSTWTRKLY